MPGPPALGRMWMLASVGEQGRVGRVGVVVEEGFQPLESALRLRILDLLDSGPGEDMMTAAKALVESEAVEQAAQPVEWNPGTAMRRSGPGREEGRVWSRLKPRRVHGGRPLSERARCDEIGPGAQVGGIQ